MRFTVSRFLALVFLAGVLALTGCSSVSVREETSNWSAEQIYQTAREAMSEGNYTRSISLYEALESRYPYGRYAQQAILETAYANYRAGETDAAIVACQRFIRLHPNHPSVDYAYYLKGLVYFREDQGILGYLHELDLSERDPQSIRDSFEAFKELVERFPDSRYTEDSKARLLYLANSMGMYQVHVARYYYKRGAYLAAINRAQRAVTDHARTPSNEEALALMVASYEKLGMSNLAEDAKRVLQTSYPESEWNKETYDGAWWRLW